MTRERLNLAGWLAITEGAICIPFIILSEPLKNFSMAGWQLLNVLFGGVNIYVFLTLRDLLHIRFKFYKTDKIINIIVWMSIGMLVVLMYQGMRDPSSKAIDPVVFFVVLLVIASGIVSIVFAVKLLSLQDNLSGMLKPYCFTAMGAGLCVASIFLLMAGLILLAVNNIILGIIFNKDVESQPGLKTLR